MVFVRIKKIIVKNLFGIFDHEIPLNLDNHITIIHGPNGFGKTILLTMLNALFTSNYHKLRSIPFSELSLHFEDNSKLQLKKGIQVEINQKKISYDAQELIFEFSKGDSKPKTYRSKPIIFRELRFPLGFIEREIPGIERIGHETWFFSPTQEILSLENVVERFWDRLPIPKPEKEEEPDWFKKIKNSTDIRFIESQRLLSFSLPRRPHEYERIPPMMPTVINYSEELAHMIQTTLAEYASLSQSLDRTFPARLVRGNSSSTLTEDELTTSLSELEEKRSRLVAAGFLDKEEEEFDIIELKKKIDKSNMNVLSIYINDVEQKLSVFDELTNKIDLLVKIINEKFLYKQMTINKKDGFVFKTPDGKTIPLKNLSSGEQHELVLHFDFLFHVKANSLILIDEPELSLHVVWQHEFLKDLEEITKLAGFDVLIATHSPQIIHDRWDLTVELKGP